MDLNLTGRAPDGLTRRARSFVAGHCIRVDGVDVELYRESWLGLGIPDREIDRAAAYAKRWGGLLMPPAPQYDGGPKYLDPDVPGGSAEEGWWFGAGDQRFSVPFSFLIGPDGAFGIHGRRWVPLHASVDGWVESVALARHAAFWARQVTKLTGDEVDALDLAGFEEVPEVRGVTDTWWRGGDSLVAVYRGEAECFSTPHARTAYVYSGLDAWGLHGD